MTTIRVAGHKNKVSVKYGSVYAATGWVIAVHPAVNCSCQSSQSYDIILPPAGLFTLLYPASGTGARRRGGGGYTP